MYMNCVKAIRLYVHVHVWTYYAVSCNPTMYTLKLAWFSHLNQCSVLLCLFPSALLISLPKTEYKNQSLHIARHVNMLQLVLWHTEKTNLDSTHTHPLTHPHPCTHHTHTPHTHHILWCNMQQTLIWHVIHIEWINNYNPVFTPELAVEGISLLSAVRLVLTSPWASILHLLHAKRLFTADHIGLNKTIIRTGTTTVGRTMAMLTVKLNQTNTETSAPIGNTNASTAT